MRCCAVRHCLLLPLASIICSSPLTATTTARLEGKFARTHTAVNETVADDEVKSSVTSTVAHVVVALKKHVIHMNHGSENVGLLLRRNVLVVKVHFVNVRIGEQLARSSPQTLGLDLFDRGKVTKRELVNRLEVRTGRRHRNTEARIAAQLGATAKKAGTPRRSKHAGLAGALAVHDLQHRFEATASSGLHRGTNQKSRFALVKRLSRFGARNVARIEGCFVGTAGCAGEAGQKGFGTRTGEAAVTTFALQSHDGLARLFARGLVRQVKLGKERMHWLKKRGQCQNKSKRWIHSAVAAQHTYLEHSSIGSSSRSPQRQSGVVRQNNMNCVRKMTSE